MKKLRRLTALALAALWLLLLPGCSLGGSAGVDELLRAPRLSGEYGEVKDALDAALGENAQLKYPYSGEFLSPYLSGDWDGDAQADMVVLYRTSQSDNVCVAAMQKDAEGVWQLAGTAEGLSATVQSIRFANLRGGADHQILVGYSTQGDEYLAVYAWQDGALQTIYQQNYEQFLIEDITGDGADDLILLLRDAASEKVQVQLLTAGDEGFSAVQAPGLSAEQFSGCAAISAGRGADGRSYLVLDGWTGATGATLASVMLAYDADTAQLTPALPGGVEDLYTASLRYSPLLTSRDMDGDGTVEIPSQPEMAGCLNLSQTMRVSFVVWRDYTSPRPDKSFGLLDAEFGYYMALPDQWQGNLMLTDGEDGALELRSLSGEQLYMTLRVVDPAADSIGWVRMRAVSSNQIQIRLGPDAGDVTAAQLVRGIHIL